MKTSEAAATMKGKELRSLWNAGLLIPEVARIQQWKLEKG
jgi:hypothetical protein